MNQQDFDLKTGNVHVHLDGKVQIWKNLIEHSGSEKGGSIRLSASKIEEGERKDETVDVLKIFEGEDTYKFYHVPTNSFPVAVIKSQREESSEEEPWGLKKDEMEAVGIDKIPKMDMTEKGYDPEDLGDYFNKLIKADIKRKIEQKIKKGFDF